VYDAPGEIASVQIDLSEFDLDGIAKLDNSVLATALQRIREEIERPDEAVAGFQSSL
jgi:FXSXX-COOH protein